MLKVSAPGKIILSGEHSVVYGYPAILASLDKRLSVTISNTKSGTEIISENTSNNLAVKALGLIEKRIKKEISGKKILISSEIPVGSGMGSSATLATCLSALLLKDVMGRWNLKEINETAYEIEKIQHGNPSGGDNTISTYGGYLWYRKEAENLKVYTKIKIKNKLPSTYLLNSGKPFESTGDMVNLVTKRYKENSYKIDKIFKEIEVVSRKILKFLLDEENFTFGELLRENQRLLEKLGVVSESTKKLIKNIEKAGGFAKISGAGGIKKGSGMILIYHEDIEKLKYFTMKNTLEFYEVKLGGEGIRIEK